MNESFSPALRGERQGKKRRERELTAYIYQRNNKKNLVAVDSLKPVFDETIFLLRRALGQGFSKNSIQGRNLEMPITQKIPAGWSRSYSKGPQYSRHNGMHPISRKLRSSMLWKVVMDRTDFSDHIFITWQDKLGIGAKGPMKLKDASLWKTLKKKPASCVTPRVWANR